MSRNLGPQIMMLAPTPLDPCTSAAGGRSTASWLLLQLLCQSLPDVSGPVVVPHSSHQSERVHQSRAIQSHSSNIVAVPKHRTRCWPAGPRKWRHRSAERCADRHRGCKNRRMSMFKQFRVHCSPSLQGLRQPLWGASLAHQGLVTCHGPCRHPQQEYEQQVQHLQEDLDAVQRRCNGLPDRAGDGSRQEQHKGARHQRQRRLRPPQKQLSQLRRRPGCTGLRPSLCCCKLEHRCGLPPTRSCRAAGGWHEGGRGSKSVRRRAIGRVCTGARVRVIARICLWRYRMPRESCAGV